MSNSNRAYELCLQAHPYWFNQIRLSNPFFPQQIYQALHEEVQQLVTQILQGLQKKDYAQVLQTCMLIEKSAPASELEGLTLLFRGLSALEAKRVPEARQLLQQCCEYHPQHAEYFQALGLSYLREYHSVEELQKATLCFQNAVKLQPELKVSHSALAMIYTLTQAWQEAETHAQIARNLGAEMGNNLLELCVMQARYEQHKTPDTRLDFSSLYFNATEAMDTLLAQFPAVNPQQLQHARQQPIIFVACDSKYFLEHALALLWSAKETQQDISLHIHFYNLDSDLLDVLPNIQQQMAPLSVQFSSEEVDVSAYACHSTVYYSCLRYCRFYQLQLANPEAPLILLDADVLLRRDVRLLFDQVDPQTGLGLSRAAPVPMWDSIIAGNTTCLPTPHAQRFLAQVAYFIADNMAQKRGRWFLDQVALCTVHRQQHDRRQFRYFPMELSCDTQFNTDAVVWAVTNELKRQNNPYNQYKKQLLDSYGRIRKNT